MFPFFITPSEEIMEGIHWTAIIGLILFGVIAYATIGRFFGNYRWLPDGIAKLSGFFAGYKD